MSPAHLMACLLAGLAAGPLLIDSRAGPVNAGTQLQTPDRRWAAVVEPAAGPAQAIGGYANGCLEGATRLPPTGPGYEVLRLRRHRFFGHPALVAFVARLAGQARQAGLAPLLIGDMAQPRGGPTLSGHKSHQTGLDVDIWYSAPPGGRQRLSAQARETLQPAALVDVKTLTLTARYSARVPRLLALAASDPAVERLFVHPAIKKALCAQAGNLPWLHKVRPWWGHHDHFHVRLTCPLDSPQCQPQESLPAGDGCDDTLAWWFSEEARAPPAAKEAAPPPPPLPAGCAALLPP